MRIPANPRPNSSRVSAVALTLSISLALLASCGPPLAEDSPPEEAAEAAVIAKHSVRRWPNGVVNLCLDELPGADPDEMREAKAEFIKALQTGWGRHADLTFNYHCPEGVPRTRLQLRPVGDLNGGGDARRIGPADPGSPDPVGELAFCAPSRSATFCRTQTIVLDEGDQLLGRPRKTATGPGDWKEKWRALVLHEVGHVLGLNHEHERWDTPREVLDGIPGVRPKCTAAANRHIVHERDADPAIASHPYDPASIMGYCRDLDGKGTPLGLWQVMDDRLSEGDRLGIRALYGPPRKRSHVVDGFLYRVDGTPEVFWIQDDVACHVSWGQFVDMGTPFVTVIPASHAESVRAKFRGDRCTKAALGATPDGYYRPLGSNRVYHLVGERACVFGKDALGQALDPNSEAKAELMTPSDGKRMVDAYFTGETCPTGPSKR